MIEGRHGAGHFWATLLVVSGVAGALLAGLLLSQADNWPRRLPPPLPTAAPVAVIGTPVTLPTSTATPSATATPDPNLTPTAVPSPTPTSITLVTSCDRIPAGWQPYTVQPGDTILALAMRYGVSDSALRLGNCLPAGGLIAGDVIFVPSILAPTPTPFDCGPPRGWVKDHVVQRGDTLSRLAVTYRTTVYQLRMANCLPDTTIRVGQRLFVPFRLVATATPTRRLLPTPTRTPSRTPTITLTPTPGMTPSPTATGTPGASPTATPQPTATGTLLPPTATATGTPPTATATPAASPNPTSSPSATPTATGTPDPTATATPNPTATNTPAPTATDIPAPSSTPTSPPPTATPTAVPPPTQAPSPTSPPPTDTPAP